MTKLLNEAFEALGRMPLDAQDNVARALLGLAEPGTPRDIEPEHLAAVLDGMAQAERGEFAAGNAEDSFSASFQADTDLFTYVRSLVDPIGGVDDLEIPMRDIGRDPPRFDD